MEGRKQVTGWESTLLAVALAIAGTLFLGNRIWAMAEAGVLSFHTLESAAPALLVMVGVGLLLAEQGVFRGSVAARQARNSHERRSA